MPLLPQDTPHHLSESTGLILMEDEKALALELAMSSMEELSKMCLASEPLWVQSSESGKVVLNFEEHARLFPWPLNNNLKQNSDKLRKEASRDSAVVIMNSITLVDAFMDAVSLICCKIFLNCTCTWCFLTVTFSWIIMLCLFTLYRC